jgi:hypothetical protein
MFHDHTEKAFTTDGMGEGGSISLVVYKEYLDEKGLPKTHGMDLKPYFTKEFWERKVPVWQESGDDWGSLALPETEVPPAPAPSQSAVNPAVTPSASVTGAWGNLFFGLLLGSLGYFLFMHRARVLSISEQLIAQFRGKTSG